MFFNSSKNWTGKLLAIQLAAIIIVTNSQTKASETLLNGKHLNVMWVCFLFNFVSHYISYYFYCTTYREKYNAKLHVTNMNTKYLNSRVLYFFIQNYM